MAVELNLAGRHLSVEVDEHERFEADDDTYIGAGHLGLFLHSIYETGHGFRNVHIEGTPSHAASNMVRTASGALLVAARLPSMCVHCSLDDGHTWDAGTVIDGSIWWMGCMCEVETDRVLFCYWDGYESLMRAQFLTVRSGRLEHAGP